jgi:ADP-heptose:LPS heptosyltransferase
MPCKATARQVSQEFSPGGAAVVPKRSPLSRALRRARRFLIAPIGAAILAMFDTAVLITTPRHLRRQTVCLIRLDAIGDFILWLESAKRLRMYYREEQVEVTLVANTAWASLARALDLADQVWELDTIKFNRDWRYRAAWVKKISTAGFEKVIQPTHSREFGSGDSLVRATRAPERVGSVGDSMNTLPLLKRWADTWYSRLVHCGDETRMELLKNADFMRGLGFADFRAHPPKLPNAEALPSTPLTHNAYAVIVPGASSRGKAWPIASYAEVGRRLAAQGLSLVIIGGHSDRAAADLLLKELVAPAEDLVGQTSLKELLSVMRNARIVISNDTGPAHIAAAVGVPVICILGGGHYGRFMPYQVEAPTASDLLPIAVSVELDCFGCNWACVFQRRPAEPMRCIKEVTVDHVWRRTVSCLVNTQSRR